MKYPETTPKAEDPNQTFLHTLETFLNHNAPWVTNDAAGRVTVPVHFDEAQLQHAARVHAAYELPQPTAIYVGKQTPSVIGESAEQERRWFGERVHGLFFVMVKTELSRTVYGTLVDERGHKPGPVRKQTPPISLIKPQELPATESTRSVRESHARWFRSLGNGLLNVVGVHTNLAKASSQELSYLRELIADAPQNSY